MKIFCIARNYKAHAEELGNKVPKEPVVFMKPETALMRKNKVFFHPEFSSKIDYEVEIVLRICKLGKHIAEKHAHTYYDKIGVGIDFTARDIQAKCKSEGLPWEISKSFDGSAAVSRFIEKDQFKNINNINFSLKQNGKTVQNANTSMMIFGFDRIISFISGFFTLKIGDLVFTGTPEGVSKININDKLEALIENKMLLNIKIK